MTSHLSHGRRHAQYFTGYSVGKAAVRPGEGVETADVTLFAKPPSPDSRFVAVREGRRREGGKRKRGGGGRRGREGGMQTTQHAHAQNDGP
jgi:hypothetical protein